MAMLHVAITGRDRRHLTALGPRLRVVVVAMSALVLLAALTVASLIGLNAECNGAGCPRSDAYRDTLVSFPILAALLLAAGAAWSIRRRRLWPLVLAEAATVASVALAGAVLDSAGVATVVWLVISAAAGRAAWRRRSEGLP